MLFSYCSGLRGIYLTWLTWLIKVTLYSKQIMFFLPKNNILMQSCLSHSKGDGFIETEEGNVVPGATIEELSRLGIDPGLFGSRNCSQLNPRATIKSKCTVL